ncbi:MAG: 50S ribosomal protein L22 [Gaiellaceae bacterium]
MSTPESKQVVRAQAKRVRVSARKARLVAEHIRGRSVPEARTVLAFTPRAAARELEKVLKSAVANAEANHGLLGDRMLVSAAYVDEGPTMKRWRPRARGRVNRILKRTCHITVLLAENPAATAPRPPRLKKGDEPARAPRRRTDEPPAAEEPKRRIPRRKKEEATA